jgi:hypothetical protein
MPIAALRIKSLGTNLNLTCNTPEREYLLAIIVLVRRNVGPNIILLMCGPDTDFIKFALSNGVFGILDGPNSMPPASLVRAKEYDYQPSPPTEVPIPRHVFIRRLSNPHIHTPVGSLSE